MLWIEPSNKLIFSLAKLSTVCSNLSTGYMGLSTGSNLAVNWFLDMFSVVCCRPSLHVDLLTDLKKLSTALIHLSTGSSQTACNN